MEWSKYSKLPKHLQREYKYKFINKPIFNVGGLILLLSVYLLIVFTTVMMFYFVISTELIAEESRDQMITNLKDVSQVIGLGTYIVIGYVSIDIGKLIIRIVTQIIWFRKNKVSVMPMWVLKKIGLPLIKE